MRIDSKEQLLHESGQVHDELHPQMLAERLQGVEYLSDPGLLVRVALQHQYRLVHELDQHGQQVAMVMAYIGLEVLRELPQGEKSRVSYQSLRVFHT